MNETIRDLQVNWGELRLNRNGWSLCVHVRIVVRSLPPNPEVPGSIPGLVEG